LWLLKHLEFHALVIRDTRNRKIRVLKSRGIPLQAAPERRITQRHSEKAHKLVGRVRELPRMKPSTDFRSEDRATITHNA